MTAISIVVMSAAVFCVFSLTGCNISGKNQEEYYALIYGVSEYSLIQDLTFTDNDAIAMNTLLSERGYNTTLRLDTEATVENLKSDVTALSSRMGPEDTFLLYFSGHGGRHYDFYGTYAKQSENEPPEADSDNEWILFYGSLHDTAYENWEETAVNDDELRTILSPLPTMKKMVIIDACNSGGFIHNISDVDAVPPNYTKNMLENREEVLKQAVLTYKNAIDDEMNDGPYDLSYKDAVVLSAAGEQEYSVELYSIEHGLFTYYFLQTPGRGDLNGDGFVTVTEAYAYTSANIEVNWNKQITNNYNYHPHITGGPMDYVLFPAD